MRMSKRKRNSQNSPKGEYVCQEVKVPAYSKVVTYAAKNLRNPDLTIIYMGQNGGFKSLDILYKQYRAMIDYAFPGDGPEHYIVLGFHNHDTVKEHIKSRK